MSNCVFYRNKCLLTKENKGCKIGTPLSKKPFKAELFNLDIPYGSEKQDHTVFLFQSLESVKGGRKDEKSSRNSHWSG